MPTENANQYATLQRLHAFPLPVYRSSTTAQKAHALAVRFTRAYDFFHETLHSSPQVGLVVLSSDDWPRYSTFPVYGLTHYDPTQNMVITGGEATTFWRPVLHGIGATSAQLLQELRSTYTQPDGSIDLTAHIDLWVVHDLGHACHLEHGYWFPRRWIMELFADLCLYTYVAAEEPSYLAVLETLPRIIRQAHVERLTMSRLQDFETLYLDMPLETYLWYHGYFFEQAKRMYAAAGVSALQDVWRSFVLADVQNVSDAEAIAMLKHIQPTIAQMVVD